ncbi:response regulator transcription factor [Sulfuritalea hydrogenivorans]|uniref:Two component transcriptional regulator, winged helix family n=1 Tax=Sulfuritalea hydrogenivorans sk43H TaxID=1223802 RepID=W0SBQ7_9PROT|nr:response regulator transcription factor [Sulfuritalea hydrogenivorans]BAO28307.1 two component transcriptional regulator, winged helix family [Sulfuritalea hydrogenivorans sk43H]
MPFSVLLVDDDVELVELLRDYLEREGFTVAAAHDGATGAAAAMSGGHDLVVLDVMMPGISGIQALARIRATSAVPVIMLTARGDDGDRITGLELGADDYVPKPCTPRELTARIRAILKRVGAAATASEQAIIAGTLTVWPAQRRAERAGKALNLTSTEFNLVEALARNAGRPVSKADLSQEVLGRPLTRFDRSIDVHMSSIRHKLGKLADGRSCIQTVIRKGYQLIAEKNP